MQRDATGGADLARLLLRSMIGGTMIAHGVRHARTLAGTAGWFDSLGFRHAKLQAKISATVEISSGTALLAGAATPVAASAVIGTLAVAAGSVHRPNGFFIVDEGYEYVLALSIAAASLASLGPGRLSVDHALGLDDRVTGRAAGLGALLLGGAGALAHLKAFWTRPE
ncbi:MAG TPA: DoxX family protein [Mycobacteriales bacterium]